MVEDNEGSSDQSAHGYPHNLKRVVHEPIKQRQKWGEPQVMPHVKWEDLFHDLFFVGLAYNLGNLVLGAWASPISILYFIGLFFACANSWYTKVYFDSRFEVGNNLYHKLLLVIELCLLATEIVHIQELPKMRKPSNYINIFAFSLSTFLHRILSLTRSMQVYFQESSSPEAKSASVLDAKTGLFSLLLCLSAAIVSGISYFGSDDHISDHHRYLAEQDTEDEKSFNDIPIYLLLCAFFSSQVVRFLEVVVFFPKDGKHKELIAPMNVEFSVSSKMCLMLAIENA